MDDNTHTDQWNFYLTGQRHYPKQDLHASHFQVDTVMPTFFSQGEQTKINWLAVPKYLMTERDPNY
jgi:hypothetical protein